MDAQRFLEFHGSRLVSAVEEHGGLELYLDAYVHEWRGDEGAGYRAPLCLVLTRSSPAGPLRVPQAISDGTLELAGTTHEGMLPLELEQDAPVRLELGFFSGERLEVRAEGLAFRSCGEPVLVERLPPDLRP